jgi:putative ABC transport system permease protein
LDKQTLDELSQSLRQILSLGSIVIGIFSVIFLFYANSFLIKRRKKEFGLFNILGMEKKHISRIMFFETLFISVISLVAGVLAGILLSKLMILLLFKIISFKATFGFEIPILAVFSTLALFGGIFTLNLIYNICQVHLSKPVELLKGGRVGEKEPKTKWILAIVGAICLGIGYYIALTTESPLAALSLFFVAVVLVITGTYCLFITGSIAILKMLRKNKKYYYMSNHFISVSGMIYRMKQNAAGLANICILSTAVIVMLSTTVSLYVGMEDVLHTRYPRHIIVNADNVSDEQANKLDAIIEQQTKKADVSKKDFIRYRFMSLTAIQNKANFTADNSSSYLTNNLAMVVFITLDDYNKMENKSMALSLSLFNQRHRCH